MEWIDQGIVLGVRRHGESSAIAELLTRAHGRHLGLVRGGAGTRLRPVLQPGNTVHAVWRARLDEHLGTYLIEVTRTRAATLLADSHAVYGVTHLASLARLLPERAPHEDIYEMLEQTLDDFADAGEAAVHLVRFELAMLAELGFGLDLSSCAATGATTDLIYVSPKSGGAVSRPAAALAVVSARGGRHTQRLVRSGSSRRLRTDRTVSASPCAGAEGAQPFRCAGRFHRCRGQAAG
jgi:DNA repair protein RecO (recombination protein O)